MDPVGTELEPMTINTSGDPARGFHGERRGRGGGRAALLSVCVAVVGMLLLGCSSSAPRQEAAQPPVAGSATSAAAPAAQAASQAQPAPRLETVKVATQPIISFAPVFVGRERGYFRQESIEIEEVAFDTSSQIMPSLAADQIDVAAGGTAAGLFNAIAQGISVRIVLDQWTAVPGNEAGGVIVRKELVDSGRVRQPSDLRGLRVGFTSKGHSTEMLMDKALSAGGVTLQDVQTTELPYPDMNVALSSANLDATSSIEPYAALASQNGWAVRWKTWAELLPNDQVAQLMYSPGFAVGRNEVAKRFAKAWIRGARDYEAARTAGTDREAVIAILLQQTIMKERPLYDIVPWQPLNPDGRVNGDAIALAQDWFVAHGYVPRPVDIPSLIDSQFADYAVAQLGPYQR